jgi:DNA-binding response OmpR family regulator
MTEGSLPSNNPPSTILLIGNTFGILKSIAYALQHRGHTVLWGDNAQSGLRIAESERPDLIVSEVELNDFSGIDVCRSIKQSFFCETPVVLVGEIANEGRDYRQARRAGADDFFTSFSDWQFVVAKFDWLLNRRYGTQERPAVPDMASRTLM